MPWQPPRDPPWPGAHAPGVPQRPSRRARPAPDAIHRPTPARVARRPEHLQPQPLPVPRQTGTHPRPPAAGHARHRAAAENVPPHWASWHPPKAPAPAPANAAHPTEAPPAPRGHPATTWWTGLRYAEPAAQRPRAEPVHGAADLQ